MKIQLIKDDVKEIVTEEENKTIQLNLERLKASNFLFPVPLKEFFDLYLYNKFFEEKMKRNMFDAMYDMESGGKTTKSIYNMHKNMCAKQMILNRELEIALQREIRELGHGFDLSVKTQELITALRIEKKYVGSKSKRLAEAQAKKQEILDEINELVNGSEPKV